MTVPAQSTLFNESTANGLTTSFPYEFKIASADDITVELNGVAQTTGFTITGVGEDVGGSVVFSVAPANGVTVLRYLDPLFNREENYPQFGDFNASVVNIDFDRMWLAMQSIMARISRAIKMPVATADDQVITENAASRAGKVLGFDASGNAVLLAKVDIGSTIVSTIGDDLLTADTAAEARSVIGAVALADLGTAALADTGDFQPADADIPTVSASQAEMEAGTEVALRSMSPLRVKQAIQGSMTGGNQSLSGNGFQKLPGGLIVQWGSGASIANSATGTITFPVAFPNDCFIVNYKETTFNAVAASHGIVSSKSATQFTWFNSSGGSTGNYWFALGF